MHNTSLHEPSQYTIEFVERCHQDKNIIKAELAREIHQKSLLEKSSIRTNLQVPQNWSAWKSPSGKVFYHNCITNQTQWKAPKGT